MQRIVIELVPQRAVGTLLQEPRHNFLLPVRGGRRQRGSLVFAAHVQQLFAGRLCVSMLLLGGAGGSPRVHPRVQQQREKSRLARARCIVHGGVSRARTHRGVTQQRVRTVFQEELSECHSPASLETCNVQSANSSSIKGVHVTGPTCCPSAGVLDQLFRSVVVPALTGGEQRALSRLLGAVVVLLRLRLGGLPTVLHLAALQHHTAVQIDGHCHLLAHAQQLRLQALPGHGEVGEGEQVHPRGKDLRDDLQSSGLTCFAVNGPPCEAGAFFLSLVLPLRGFLEFVSQLRQLLIDGSMQSPEVGAHLQMLGRDEALDSLFLARNVLTNPPAVFIGLKHPDPISPRCVQQRQLGLCWLFFDGSGKQPEQRAAVLGAAQAARVQEGRLAGWGLPLGSCELLHHCELDVQTLQHTVRSGDSVRRGSDFLLSPFEFSSELRLQ